MSDYLKITEMASKSLERWITQEPPKRDTEYRRPEWVGLTESDIYEAMDFDDEFEFARALEAKLKEKNT
jgi:hypothetical protein